MNLKKIEKLAKTVARYDGIAMRAYDQNEEKFNPKTRDRAVKNDNKFHKATDALVEYLYSQGVNLSNLNDVKSKINNEDLFSVWIYIAETMGDDQADNLK